MRDATYEQLAERLSEALDEKAKLADEVDRLERELALLAADNREIRDQLRMMRAA